LLILTSPRAFISDPLLSCGETLDAFRRIRDRPNDDRPQHKGAQECGDWIEGHSDCADFEFDFRTSEKKDGNRTDFISR